METIRKILPYLIIFITIFLGVAVWFSPPYIYPPSEKLPAGSKELIDVQNDLRKTGVQIIGGRPKHAYRKPVPPGSVKFAC